MPDERDFFDVFLSLPDGGRFARFLGRGVSSLVLPLPLASSSSSAGLAIGGEMELTR